MSRLEILENSLAKKEAKLKEMYKVHFADVERANGQPLNDKNNGQATLNRWDKARTAIHNQEQEIEKTKKLLQEKKQK